MTSIYQVSDSLMGKVWQSKGLPSSLSKESLPDVAILREMRAAYDLLESGWKEYIDGLTLAQMTSAERVTFRASGDTIRVVADPDGERVSLAGRNLPMALAKRKVAEVVPWFEFSKTEGNFWIKAADSAGTIRSRAFGEWLNENVGTRSRFKVSTASDEGVQLSSLSEALDKLKLFADRKSVLDLARKSMRRASAPQPEEVKRDTTSGFIKHIEQVNSRHNEGKSIELLPVPRGIMKTSRQWGIEVEAAGARGINAPQYWSRKGDGSLRSAYGGNSTYIDAADCEEYDHREFIENEAGERVPNEDYYDPEDCEYCGERYDDYEGHHDSADTGEFVSPILKSFHSSGLRTLTKQLSKEPQNDSAGVHVHVDASGMTAKQLGSLVYGYQIIEPLITAAYRRERRNYCKPRSAEDVLRVMRSSKQAKRTGRQDDTGNGPVLNHGDRYHSVNLSALSAHGTVEFRAMGPVYRYETLIRWAFFCREMMNVASKDVPEKVWASVKTWADVEKLFARYGDEYPKVVAANMESMILDDVDVALV